MNTIHWHMNATQGGANLRPGVNLLPGMQIVHMNMALARIKNMRTACLVFNQNMVDSYPRHGSGSGFGLMDGFDAKL